MRLRYTRHACEDRGNVTYMKIRAILDRAATQAELAALLPTVLEAERVDLLDGATQFFIQVDDGNALAFEDNLGHALKNLKLAWRSERSADELPALYESMGAVLTVIVPEAVALPPGLMPQLVAWELEVQAIRRLSAPDAGELAFELYFGDWERCRHRREAIGDLADAWGIDLALAPADTKRPRRRILAFDMDSTLIGCEVIDELAARAGVGEAVAAVTERAMRGELDFRSSFRERMAKLAGLPAAALEAVAAELPLMDGAVDLLSTLRAQGHYTMILSGGFDYFARRLQKQLGVHEVRANHLQIRGGVLTGEVDGAIVDGERKVQFLRAASQARGIPMADTVAVGDGANDLPMLGEAGLGVAFHAKPLVRERAPHAMTHCDLTGLLYLLGVPRGAGGAAPRPA